MANKKISQLTPKGSALAGTDLLEVSVFNGVTYDTKSLTGANVVSGLQPTLFSGTNIKTINSTSLLGSGDIVISTGLTVGTTPITSGTVGRVLFEGTGNVVQQDSTLFWDNTNKRLGVGATPSTSVRLDVRAQGALSTDIAFRVRNSADNANIFQINGDSSGGWNIDSKVIKFGSGSRITTGANYLDGVVVGFSLYSCALSTAFQAQGNSINNLKQICIGGAYDDNEASAIFYNIAGTPSVVANTFKMYSNDIVAGNACPHFKTEAGNIIKLYKETTAVAAAAFVANTSLIANDSATFGGYTMGQVVAALKAQGLLA